MFITHSSNQGIFEFIDQVSASWPCCRQASYCSILSEPQNLDLRRSGGPDNAPSRVALKASKTVLVVSDRRVSRNSRLFFETYLACIWDKYVIFAHSPVGKDTRRLWAYLLIAFILGTFLGMESDWCSPVCGIGVIAQRKLPSFWRSFWRNGRSALLCALTLNCMRSFKAARILSFIGMTVVGLDFVTGLQSPTPHVTRFMELWIAGYFTIVYELKLHESLRGQIRMLEKSWESRYSTRDDGCGDWNVGHRSTEADMAMRQLLHAGVSAKSFRIASGRGVNLEDIQLGNFACCTVGFRVMITDNLDRDLRIKDTLSGINIALAVLWSLMYTCSYPEKQLFSSLVLVKLYWIFQILPFVLWKKIILDIFIIAEPEPTQTDNISATMRMHDGVTGFRLPPALLPSS